MSPCSWCPMRKPANNLHILLAQKKTGKGNWWAFLQPMMEKKPSDKQPQCYLKCVRQGSACGKLLACSKPPRSANDHYKGTAC